MNKTKRETATRTKQDKNTIEIKPEAKRTVSERARRRTVASINPRAYEKERIWWLRRKHWGEWAEMQFQSRASLHGLVVSKPWGETARYDFLVDSEGRVSRVQVKSTAHRRPNGHYMIYTTQRVGNKPGLPRKMYTKDQIDFFAYYLLPEDTWYIVPVNIRGTTGAIIDPRDPASCYAPYREAWRLLKQ